MDTEETEIAANFAALNTYNGPLRLSTILVLELDCLFVHNVDAKYVFFLCQEACYRGQTESEAPKFVICYEYWI